MELLMVVCLGKHAVINLNPRPGTCKCFPFLDANLCKHYRKNASTNFKFAKAITIFLKNNGKIRENYVHKMCGPHPEKS